MRSRYRSIFETSGDVHFVTSTVAGFVEVFNHRPACDIFVDCVRYYVDRGDLTIIAWVLMPNHFHMILKRVSSQSVSQIVGNIKRLSARKIGELGDSRELRPVFEKLARVAPLDPGKGTSLWKPRFDCLTIVFERTLRQKLEYIHANPVRAGLVGVAADWTYSSAPAYAGAAPLLPVDVGWKCLGYGGMPSGRGS